MVPAAAPAAPGWLQRLGAVGWRILVIVALAGILVALAFVLSTVTATVIVAFIVAATFTPLHLRLLRRGWSPTASAATVTGAAVAVALLVGLLLAWAFLPYVPNLVAAVRDGIAELTAELDAAASTDLADEAQAVADGIMQWLQANAAAIAGQVANAATVALLSLFLTFFLLQDGDKGWGRTLEVTDGWRRDRINAAGREALDRVGGYLRGTAVISAIVAVTDLAYLTLLGVPLAAPLAVLVFAGGFIPYIGGLLATITLLIVTWGTQGANTALILFLLITVTRVIVSNVLRPMIYGRTVRLHPAVILLVLPAGAAVAGIFGVFAAVPVTVLAASITTSVIAALEPPPETPTVPGVPPWLDRVAQWGWRLLVVLGVTISIVSLMSLIPMVVAPIMIAAILAATVAPLHARLRSRGWGTARAAAAITGGSFLAVIALGWLAIAAFGPALVAAVEGAIVGGDEAGTATGGLLGWLGSVSAELGGTILETIGAVLSAVSALVIMLLLSGLLMFYLLRDGRRSWDGLIGRASAWRREVVDSTVRESVTILGGYMGGTAAISAVGAISQFAIMIILGLPYALPIAVLSFFLCFIPYLGGFVSTGLAFLIAVAFGDGSDVLVMGVYTLVFNIVQGNIVTPLVYRHAVHLHPAVILLAIPAGGALAGIVGMFLAVPVLALVAGALRPALRLMGEEPTAGRPAVAPEVRPADG